MNIEEIIENLPHRYPFLLVDKVISIEPGKSLVAIKNVTINEPFFIGHFPNKPVMPGVLILEALAQACGVLAYKSSETKASSNSLFYFAGIDNARFKRIVVPGDQLRLEVEVTRVKQEIWKCKAQATVEDHLACSAEILAVKKDNP